MSTSKAIGYASTIVEPDTPEGFSLATVNNNYDAIITEVNTIITRPLKSDRQMQFSNGGFAWSANANWDAGTLSADASSQASSQVSSPLPSFCTPGSLSGTLKFTEPGEYDVRWYNTYSADPGASGYTIGMSGTWPGSPDTPNTVLGRKSRIAGSYYWETQCDALNIRVPSAGLEIRFTGQQANACTVTPRIKVYQKAKFI